MRGLRYPSQEAATADVLRQLLGRRLRERRLPRHRTAESCQAARRLSPTAAGHWAAKSWRTARPPSRRRTRRHAGEAAPARQLDQHEALGLEVGNALQAEAARRNVPDEGLGGGAVVRDRARLADGVPCGAAALRQIGNGDVAVGIDAGGAADDRVLQEIDQNLGVARVLQRQAARGGRAAGAIATSAFSQARRHRLLNPSRCSAEARSAPMWFASAKY